MRPNSTQKELTSTSEVQNILLYVESGDVTFKITGTQEFKKATSSPIIIPNQTIVHTDIGRASVLMPDNSNISLDKNTEITISYTENKTSIYQTLGTTYHRVEKLLSGATYQVQTPGTLAAVRGTKFAVKYDTKTKKTKIAVTENKVQVSTISKAVGTTTPPVEETTIVEEGKTVSVAMVVGIPKEGVSAMQVVETKNDAEMRIWVDEQKKEDIQLETIKRGYPDEDGFRKEMKRVLFDDVTSEKTQNDTTSSKDVKVEKTSENEVTKTNEETVQKNNEPVKVEVKTETPVTKTTQESSVTTETVTPTVKKLGEEEFFNVFNDMFMKYFYIDDTDGTCMVNVTPDERVRFVSSYATASGYPFTSTTLLSFARAIDAYCSQKDNQIKIKLQGRFDDEFPFKENI